MLLKFYLCAFNTLNAIMKLVIKMLLQENIFMKSILLIGLGRFGKHTAVKLNELGHEVMAIDKNEDRVDEILPYVTSAQIGDCTNEELLSNLGVSDFDVCIVAIGDDFQSSLEITALLKDLGARHIVSRASRDVHAKFLKRNGADDVVYPENQLARWTAIRYSSDSIFDYIELDDDYAVFELSVPKSWVGKTIGHLNIRKNLNINIIAVKQFGHIKMNISSDTVLNSEETLLVLGNRSDIHKCFHI